MDNIINEKDYIMNTTVASSEPEQPKMYIDYFANKNSFANSQYLAPVGAHGPSSKGGFASSFDENLAFRSKPKTFELKTVSGDKKLVRSIKHGVR
jgi:hypothetical protein